MLKNNFSNNLKYLRIKNKMLLQDVAKKMDRDSSTIGKWEAGTREPSFKDIIQLSEIFNTTVTNLLCGELYKQDEEVEVLTAEQLLSEVNRLVGNSTLSVKDKEKIISDIEYICNKD